MIYTAGLDNTYNTINAPFVIEMGKKTTKAEGYQCLTKVPSANILLKYQDDGMIEVNNHAFMVSSIGSYSVLCYDTSNPMPVPLSVYAYQSLFINNTTNILQIISQELPAIYSNDNLPNLADNFATAAVFERAYSFIYKLFYDAVSSVGEGKEYNRMWEQVYIGSNDFLLTAKYPAEFIKTLMQVGTRTGVKIKDISIVISRLMYQFSGFPFPVEIVFDDANNRYDVNIYNMPTIMQWVLGYSQLGINTILTTELQRSDLWFIYLTLKRLMPVFVKFRINYFDADKFNTDFRVDLVDENDYLLDSVNYNAYMVVNNNNIYNTKGYIYA